MEYVFTDGQLDPPADDDVISNAVERLGVVLPDDYIQFLRTHSGGEGLIGENYIVLWKTGELRPFNEEYEVDQYAPGGLLFGSSGGGEGYRFDTQDATMPVVRIPFIGMDRQYAVVVARSCTDLLVVQ